MYFISFYANVNMIAEQIDLQEKINFCQYGTRSKELFKGLF